MAERKFFAPKHDQGKHPSMRSHLRGLQASTLKLTMWRREREAALEAGHRPPELCFPGEIGGHFQDDNGETTSQQVLRTVERGETQIFANEKSTT